jgi:hypothetical protein
MTQPAVVVTGSDPALETAYLTEFDKRDARRSMGKIPLAVENRPVLVETANDLIGTIEALTAHMQRLYSDLAKAAGERNELISQRDAVRAFLGTDKPWKGVNDHE